MNRSRKKAGFEVVLIGHRAHARLVVGVSVAPAGLTAARPAWRAPGAFCGCTSKGRTLSLYPLEKRRVGPLPRRRKTASRLCSSCCLTLWRTAAPRAASSTSPRRFRSFRPSSAAGATRPGRPPRTQISHPGHPLHVPRAGPHADPGRACRGAAGGLVIFSDHLLHTRFYTAS